MNFVQAEFLGFFLAVFCLYWLLRERRAQNLLLVVASAVFYGWIHPWFLGLLWFSAILDYSVGRLMVERPQWKRALLAASLTGNLGMLGLFKYYDFFVDNMVQALSMLGVPLQLGTLGLILPVGISFYTFQTLSYTIDVYRGRLAPRRDALDYLVYVGFFPQLVAGPIERASTLLPQVERARRFDGAQVVSGLSLAMWGAFQKVCIADAIAPYVDKVFVAREPPTALVLVATFGFGVQILADFSGYTDLARGTARMLGFELSRNFDRPYRAASTPDFWRRWHITLSSWVADYVYTPLLRAGRPSAARVVMANLVTFLAIGLWHGAAWNFVLLGLFNGLCMSAYLLLTPLVPSRLRAHPAAHASGILLHTAVVLTPTALLFREPDMARAWAALQPDRWPVSRDEAVAVVIVLAMAGLGAVIQNTADLAEDHVMPRLRDSWLWVPAQTTFSALAAVAVFVMWRDASADFIYFEF